MRADKRFPAPGRERGVMLIEALVAILIFSIGILAVVGMQAVAIKDVTAAKYRSEAAFLAQELLAQMWTDNGNINTYAFTGAGAPPAKIQLWVNKVQSRLPDGANQPPSVTLTNPTRLRRRRRPGRQCRSPSGGASPKRRHRTFRRTATR